MRWLGLVVLLAGCDALFQIDHLKDPRDGGAATEDSALVDGMLVDAPHDAVPGRARFVQAAQTLVDGAVAVLSIPQPQVANDLNVLCISWVGASNALMLVQDSAGNLWANTSNTGSSVSTNQVMYYAYGIKPGMNQVTVTFTASVSMINLRLVEYANIPILDPKLGAYASTGNGATMTSATLTVGQKALLVGGFVSSYTSITPGASYVERIEQTFGYLEDREVTATGAYNATAQQGNSGAYIAHIAAFSVL
jgi:hypothetical protein